jgi:hypothetical protein
MAGKKMPAFLTEKYGKKVEKYKSKAAKGKHEKGEGRKELAMESKAEKAKAKMKKGVKGGKNVMGTNKAGQRTAAQRG